MVNTNTFLVGTASVGSMELVQQLPTENHVGLILQVIIGIITIFKMFKKSKPASNDAQNK